MLDWRLCGRPRAVASTDHSEARRTGRRQLGRPARRAALVCGKLGQPAELRPGARAIVLGHLPGTRERDVLYSNSTLATDPASGDLCGATIWMRSAEPTGAGESVRVRQEGKANHYFHREPCGRTREGAFEASAAARVAGMIEQRKRYGPECRGFPIGRRQYLQNRNGEGLPGSALSEESRDARTPLAGTREGFDSPWQSCRGRGRKEVI